MIYISQPRSWRNIVQQCTAIIITFTMLTVIIAHRKIIEIVTII